MAARCGADNRESARIIRGNVWASPISPNALAALSRTKESPSLFVTRPVNTHIFAPFLVARLEEHPAVRDRALLYEVTIENLGETERRSLPLTLAWTEAMVPPVPLAAQLEYITEAAACGLALAALSHLTAAVLVDVADRGDRFDYIVEVNGVQCGLEISGSQTLEKRVLRERHEQKIE